VATFPFCFGIDRRGATVWLTVCCSVLQCIAVRCCVLQSCRSSINLGSRHFDWRCVAVCCSVLQCIAVCCSVVQCVAVRCCVLQSCHSSINLGSRHFDWRSSQKSPRFQLSITCQYRWLSRTNVYKRASSHANNCLLKSQLNSNRWSPFVDNNSRKSAMGWLRWVGSLKLYVSFAECSLFYRALLQKRQVIFRSLLIVATPYIDLV